MQVINFLKSSIIYSAESDLSRSDIYSYNCVVVIIARYHSKLVRIIQQPELFVAYILSRKKTINHSISLNRRSSPRNLNTYHCVLLNKINF